MKKIYYITLCFTGIILLCYACESFRNVSDVKDVQSLSALVKATVQMDGTPDPGTLNVRLINHNEPYELTTTLDVATGQVTVENVIPGIYTIMLNKEVLDEGFTYYYSGSASNVPIVNNATINIDVSVSRSGAIILKEIFYAGSKTPSGGSYFRDQFYELYNNSAEVQYLDSLCFCISYDGKAEATVPNWDPPYNTGYVFTSVIWQIAGSGTDYPLQPGESVVLAQMADNHQKATLNPTSPVNLLSAEFEFFSNNPNFPGNNPAIDLKLVYGSVGYQYLTTVFGAAYIIFRPSVSVNPNLHAHPEGKPTVNCSPIRIDEVIDAVEAVDNSSKLQWKRLPSVLDAGATTVEGTYNTTSIARKIKETLPDGRIVFYDTNNSADDFEMMAPPMIRRYNPGIPSWNTWKDLQ